MNADSLRTELRALHRGRGVRRPDVHSWLGPELQSILGITSHTSDEEARTALILLLDAQLASFPRDLRDLLLIALGVDADQPFLAQRLARAEATFDRSSRVLRRRLRVAEQLLIDSLLAESGRGSSVFDNTGWQWEQHDIDLVLRDTATLTLSRTLRSLTDEPVTIYEAFGIPDRSQPDAELSFRATEGFTVADVERPSSTLWGVTLRLPTSLRRGDELRTSLEVTVSDARALNPFLALAPLRPCRRARISVDFGEPRLARRAWVLDGVVASDMAGFSAEVIGLDLAAGPVVSASFASPRQGLAYGIGWEWQEPDAPAPR